MLVGLVGLMSRANDMKAAKQHGHGFAKTMGCPKTYFEGDGLVCHGVEAVQTSFGVRMHVLLGLGTFQELLSASNS